MISGDVYRPAAINQLQVLGEQIGAPVYTVEGEKDPVKIALDGIKHGKANAHDVIIVDSYNFV